MIAMMKYRIKALIIIVIIKSWPSAVQTMYLIKMLIPPTTFTSQNLIVSLAITASVHIILSYNISIQSVKIRLIRVNPCSICLWIIRVNDTIHFPGSILFLCRDLSSRLQARARLRR